MLFPVSDPLKKFDCVVLITDVGDPTGDEERFPELTNAVTESEAVVVILSSRFLRFAETGTSSVIVVPPRTFAACPNFFSVRAI